MDTNNTANNVSQQIESLLNISNKIGNLSSIFIISIGLISNILSFIIYKREVFKKQSIGTYLSWLSISNLIVLLSLFGKLINTFDVKWMKTNIYCSFYGYFQYTSLQYCSWILVLNSFNHIFSFKSKPKFIKKRIYQVSTLLIVLMLLLLVNIPHLYNSEYNDETSACGHSNKKHGLWFIDIVDLIVCILIPFILMIISTTIILVRLFNWNNTSRTLKDQRQVLRRKAKFAITVTGLNLLFLISNLPITILLVIINYRSSTFENRSVDDENSKNVKFQLILSIFRVLMYSYNSSLLIVSLISNRIFRQEFYNLLK